MLALRAQTPRQALRDDEDHGGGDVKRRHTHVRKARQRSRCVVGVQRGEHHVAGLRGLDRDFRGLEVADFADHHDIRVLAQKGA